MSLVFKIQISFSYKERFEFLTKKEREREREMNDEIETSRLIGLSNISKKSKVHLIPCRSNSKDLPK